jgi:hypothetical protein
MANSAVYKAMDVLQEYPAIREYIKHFTGYGGFMYTIEIDPQRIALKRQMEDLLDAESHSGSAWGCLLRVVQSILNGTVTVEQLQEEDRVIEDQYQAFFATRTLATNNCL